MDRGNKLKLEKILARNFFISEDLLEKIKFADDSTQEKILPILQKIDNLQTALIKSVVAKNPNFFSEIKNNVQHEFLAKLVKQEISEHETEIDDLEKEMEETLRIL